jgi:hypothetical protein
LDVIEKAITNGDVLLIENIGESVVAVLEPLFGRMLVRMGEKEIDYNQNFRLILHTKLGNPHYKPEIQAYHRNGTFIFELGQHLDYSFVLWSVFLFCLTR